MRATLAFVARGETPLGIVYETDAKVEPKVKIVGDFRMVPIRRSPIRWRRPRQQAGAARYVQFLRGSEAKAIFEKYGFSFLIKPVS